MVPGDVYKTTFERAGVGIAHVDLKGNLIRANSRMLKILRRTEEELTGLHFSRATHADDAEVDQKSFDELKSGNMERYIQEKRYLRPDGSILWGQADGLNGPEALGRAQVPDRRG